MIPPHLPPEEPQHAPAPAPLIYLPEKRTWQYKILHYQQPNDTLPTEAVLDELGAAGWELAAILPTDGSIHFYFKRLQ
jgi:hypothetical protein